MIDRSKKARAPVHVRGPTRAPIIPVSTIVCFFNVLVCNSHTDLVREYPV